MLHRRRPLTTRVCRLASCLMTNELLACDRMLTFIEPLKMLFADLSAEAPAGSELARPHAANHLAFRVVVLTRVLEFFGVVTLRLARAEGLGDGQHEPASLKEWLLPDGRGRWPLMRDCGL